MSRMLLSIKPEYVKKILSGQKTYEFRKFHCHADIDTIVIYCTSPVKMVVAEAKLLNIVEGTSEDVWEQTKGSGGITEQAYNEYYQDRETATAYHLGPVTIYESPISLSDVGLSYVPQSFAYLST